MYCSGGGGGGSDDILCFTRDALVEMADGSLKRIADVKEGDKVYTGFPGDEGLVTAVLSHDVNEKVQVSVIPTPLGDLIGTPDHPVYFNNEWMELEEAMKYDTEHGENFTREYPFKLNGLLKRQHVDVFYNLEIDGNKPGSSSHSYVVNGVIASGLGDNHVLNTLFARQKFWKVAQQ